MSIFNKQKASFVINLLLEISLYIFPATLLFKWSHANAICVLMFVLYLTSLSTGRSLPQFGSPLSLPVFLFLLAVFIPSIITIGLADTWREGKHVLYSMGIFFIYVDQISRQPVILKRSLLSLMMFSAFLSLDSFLQWFTGKDIIGMELFGERSTAVFANPNYLCFFISGTIPVLFFHLQETTNVWFKILDLLLLIFSYITIMLAGAKTGFSVMVLFFIFYLVQEKKKEVWALIALGLGTMVLFFYDPIGIKNRFLEFYLHGDDRWSLWIQTYTVFIKPHQFLGMGLDTFKAIYPAVKISEISYSAPHNFFLEIWQTSGIIALCVFVYILLKTIALSIMQIRKQRIHVYLFISIVMLFLTSAVSIPVFSKYFSFYFWLYLGLFAGAMQIHPATESSMGG